MKYKQRLSFKVFMAFCFIVSCIFAGEVDANDKNISSERVRSSVRASGSLDVSGTQIIDDACQSTSVTVSGTVTGTVDDDSGYDLISFELWDDHELKDSKDIRVEVGSTENVSITLSFDTLYGTEAQGVGVYVYELGFKMDPFYPTDKSGSCYGTQTLSVSTIGTGNGIVKSSPVGIDCGSDCSENYISDSSVTLTATPEIDSAFAGWTGNCSGSSPTCTVKMGEDKDVTAEFVYTAKPSLTLSSSSGAPGGTVTLNLELGNTTNTSVVAISTDIDFDSAVFESYPNDETNAKNPSAVIGAAGAAAGKDVDYKLLDSNTLRVSVVSANRNAINNGIVASITFYIKPTAINTTTELTQTPTASDVNANSLTITGIKGSVTIKDCKLGDCNCDGTVSIAEVQSAIKMHMGKKPVESCCDRNSDGKVTIDEVQAIVNNHLGIVVTHATKEKKRAAQINVGRVSDGYSLSLDSNKNSISTVSIDVAYPVELAGKVSFTLGASAELAGKELVQNQIQPGITRIALISTFDNEAIDDGEILFVQIDGDSADGDMSFEVTASDEAGGEIQVK